MIDKSFQKEICKFHNIPCGTICTYENCDTMYLCDICVNVHPKDHKYLISIESLKANSFETIIDQNEKIIKDNETLVNDIYENYSKKIESDLKIFKDTVYSMIEKYRLFFTEWLNSTKSEKKEEASSWSKLKNEYSKAYNDYFNNDNLSDLNYSNITDTKNNRLLNKNYSLFSDNSIKIENSHNLFGIINKILSLQIQSSNCNLTSILFNNLIVQQENDVSPYINTQINFLIDNINSHFTNFREDLKKIVEEKFHFTNKINTSISTFQENSPKVKKIMAQNKIFSSSPILTQANRETINSFQNFNNNVSSKKKKKNNQNPNFKSDNSLIEMNNSTKIKLIDPDKVELSSVNIFIDKKGSWYTIEFIEDLQYIIIGYSTGEILIFKENDLTLIRTFRPRFKRIRKIIYSPENSSIFACYDDGYLVVINVIDFKIVPYRISTGQVYTMEIMRNQNILVFGGVEKKVSYTYIINLNKILLFYESNEGEIQSLLYDEKLDYLICGFRKKSITFFKYSTTKSVFKYEFQKEDCCVMNLKKYKEDIVISCGYFLNLAVFKMHEGSVEFSFYINCEFIHIYDVHYLGENYFLVTTFDENKIALVDIKQKKCVKIFDGFKGALQLKIIKNTLYVSSHSESVKKTKIHN